MAMSVEWAPYGRRAAHALRAAVLEAKGTDPLAPVTVVVPSNQVGVAARRLLGSGELGPSAGGSAGIAAVSFLTVYRLAELLGAARLAAQGRRPVSVPVIACALRGALNDEPGIFAPVAGQAATEDALVSAYRELRDIPGTVLERLAAQSRRAADVVRLCRAARRRLQAEFSDEEDLMEAAVQVVRSATSPQLELGRVVVYLPQRVSLHGAALLKALDELGEVLVIAGSTGDDGADADVWRSLQRLEAGGAVKTVTAPATHGAAVYHAVHRASAPSPVRTRALITPDPDEEVRAAVRAVVEAARDGVPLERIAVLYGSHEPYARLVHEHFAAAGIKHNGDPVIPLKARMASRALLGFLGLPASNFRRDELFAWLTGARVRDGRHWLPVTAWERVSRDAGVVAGRQEWDQRLSRYAEECDTEAEQWEADPDLPAWRPARARDNAEHARQLRTFVLRLIDDLSKVTGAPRPWSAHASWASAHLRNLTGNEWHRAKWPVAERKAAERTERAVERLACLEAIEGPVPLDVFVRTLELELDRDLGRVGRMGEGVLVGGVSMGTGLDLDLVVVLGLAEGSFPSPPAYDSLLPDEERLAAGDGIALCAASTERQHRELLAALAGARQQLLCVPRGDMRQSNERFPSRWVTDIASRIEGRPVSGQELLVLERPWVEHVASYEAGVRKSAPPATAQEYRLQALLAHRHPADHSEDLAGGLADPVLAAGAAMLHGRRGIRFTRFDGNLGGLNVPSPAEALTSATRLESWARCPFAYFMADILRVRPVESPEDRLQISPLDLGQLVHKVLEAFLKEVLQRPPADQPGPLTPWSAGDRGRMTEIAETICDQFQSRGLVGRPVFWQGDRRRLLADFERFLDFDDRRRAADLARPIAAELSFGQPKDDLGPVELRLPDGRTVAFRGAADRLDLTEDGKLRVVDYKTGRVDSYLGLSQAAPDDGGKRLQLVVYALAARAQQHLPEAPVISEYWFITTKGKFSRVGYEVTADVLDRVTTTVDRLVAGIESGVFPNYPTAVSTNTFVECEYCDPDHLGVVELKRQLERKRTDPRLADFLALAEGAPTGTSAGGDGTDGTADD